MNYEKFFFWLEGYLEAWDVTERNGRQVVGSTILKKMNDMLKEGQIDYTQLTPTLPDLPPYNVDDRHVTNTKTDIEETVKRDDLSFMEDFLKQDLPEEDIPTIGEKPPVQDLEWKLADEDEDIEPTE
jgi:Asp-tRNA(Asn)/Glu-tRNA(Gln) amidotransferase B subunit